MTLPLVDFVHPDALPATSVAVRVGGEDGPSVEVRALNRDVGGGSRTLAVDVPASFELPGGRWSCDVEVFVLDGTLQVGDDRLERYGYLFVPVGVAVGPLAAGDSGARMLVFASGLPQLVPADDDAAGAARHRLVGPVHAADVPWERPRTPDFPAGGARKTLREDDETAEAFWLLGVLPHWSSPMTEWHTFAEENVILEGEVQTAVGTMRAGAYLAHPAGEEAVHGPMRSRSGALMITRATGRLGTTYTRVAHELEGAWR